MKLTQQQLEAHLWGAVSKRRLAIERALENSAQSGVKPTKYAQMVYERWIEGLPLENASGILRAYHQELERLSPESDGKASPNPLGITDSGRLKDLKADLRALKDAQTDFDPDAVSGSSVP